MNRKHGQRWYVPPLNGLKGKDKKPLSMRCMATTISSAADGDGVSLPMPQLQIHRQADGIISDYDYKKGVKYLVDNAPAGMMKMLPPAYVLPLPENPLSATYGDIPIIDLSGLNGPPESTTATVKAISSASSTWGFFRIVNHGVDVSLMEEMLKVTEGFFDLSLAEKMRYASDDVMSPVRYGTSLSTSNKHSLHWRDFLRHYGQESSHLWPLNPPNYRDVVKEYVEKVRGVAMRIAGALSEGLGLPQGYIEETMLGDGFQIIALNYYPPCPEPHRTLGHAAHSDYGGITILMDNGVQGLQVNHNGAWVAIPHLPTTFLVNIGDCIEILCNGKYKSVEHRATVNGEKVRISVAVASGPNLWRRIGPERAVVAEKGERMKFRTILYQDYLRLQQSSTLKGKTTLDAIRIN